MEEKCVYCGGDLPEKPTKVKVRTRSFEVCCADCAEKTEQYIKLDKRFKTALYLLVFLGGIGFVISAFFGGDSPLRLLRDWRLSHFRIRSPRLRAFTR